MFAERRTLAGMAALVGVGLWPSMVADHDGVVVRGGHRAIDAGGAAHRRLPRSAGDDAVLDAAFATTMRGYEISAGRLRETLDGGTRWRTLAVSVPGGASLAVLGAHTVLLIGGHGVLRSTNRGATFSPVTGRVPLRSGRPGPRLAGLPLSGSDTVGSTVLAWDRRRLYESTDGGARWRLATVPHLSDTASAVSFVSVAVR